MRIIGIIGYWLLVIGGVVKHTMLFILAVSLISSALCLLGDFFFLSRVSLRALRYGTGRSTWDADGCHDIV